MFNQNKEFKLRKLDQILKGEIPIENSESNPAPNETSKPWYNYSFDPEKHKIHIETIEEEKPAELLSTKVNKRSMNRRFSQLLGGSYCPECGGPCGNHSHIK